MGSMQDLHRALRNTGSTYHTTYRAPPAPVEAELLASDAAQMRSEKGSTVEKSAEMKTRKRTYAVERA